MVSSNKYIRFSCTSSYNPSVVNNVYASISQNTQNAVASAKNAVASFGGTMATGSGISAFAVNVPMGIGVKFKLKERLNLGLEFTMRKSFGDKLDGLSDLNGVKSSFAKNTDWYSFTMFTVTYEFSKRCKKCHYVD